MIVALSGSHSTGKSTLVEFFKGKEGFSCIDSVTRSTISKEERRIDDIRDLNDAQLRILENIKDRMSNVIETNNRKSDQVYLLDRRVFDFIAYTRCFVKKGLVTGETLQRIERECETLIPHLDLVGYLDIEFKIVDDGSRSLDEDLRQDVDREILNELLWSGVRTVKLGGTVLERVKNLQKSIDLIRNQRL